MGNGTSKNPRIVIVGGGFGGLVAAQSLKKALADVTLVDRRNHHLFQPLLYQVATAGLSPADIAAPIRAVLRNQKNVDVVMDEVIGVDPQNKLVSFAHRQLSYDYLILATGSSQSYFGHDDWMKHAPGLKSIRDATLLRERILNAFEAAEIETNLEKKKQLLTFVLVGAGPTGVEMAGSIAELAYFALKNDFRHIDPRFVRIVLIEASPRILAGFHEDLAKKATKKLVSLGVEIQTGARVQRLDVDYVYFSGKEVKASTIIWCAGVQASLAGKWLGAEVDRAGRVLVKEDFSVTGHPEIFVIGDTASYMQDGKPLPGLAPVAMQEGRYVAGLIRRKIEGRGPSKPFRYVNKGNLATVGRSFAIAEFGNFRISGFFAWIMWIVVHIYYLIDFRNRVLVMIQWAWAYITFQRGARLITSEKIEIS